MEQAASNQGNKLKLNIGMMGWLFVRDSSIRRKEKKVSLICLKFHLPGTWRFAVDPDTRHSTGCLRDGVPAFRPSRWVCRVFYALLPVHHSHPYRTVRHRAGHGLWPADCDWSGQALEFRDATTRAVAAALRTSPRTSLPVKPAS